MVKVKVRRRILWDDILYWLFIFSILFHGLCFSTDSIWLKNLKRCF